MTDNLLPGEKVPYFLKAGEGGRYLFAGQLATYIARQKDTGGLLDAVVFAGGKGAGMPLHLHRHSDEALFVVDGHVELRLGAEVHELSAGDFANIPAGTPHTYTMLRHRTLVLSWTAGGDAGQLAATLGTPTDAYIFDSGGPAEPALWQAGTAPDTEWVHESAASGAAFVLEAGEGERLVAGDQLFTLMANQSHTGGRFIAITTQGPRGGRIPLHFHERHTENFFCLEGRMTMWADGEEIAIGPGDFLHVPPGTIHSYRLDAPFTNFLGILTPGLFEPFFRTLCDPYEGYAYPAVPGPVRFDRVIARLNELDLKLVERPGPPPR